MKKEIALLSILAIGTIKVLAGSESVVNNNINIYASTNQTTNTSNALTAVQQTIPTALLKELAHGGESFMNKNKLFITAIAGAYAYGRTFMSIVQANHELARTDAWASWKAELSVDALKSQDHEALTKELLFEIQKRHTNADKPADALMPFITFLSSIDEEIAAINHYRSLHFWLESCHATWLFPVNKNRFASASSRLERLWFIKNLFLQWAAEYKLSTLAPRSAFSTVSNLYHYFAHKLNFITGSTHDSLSTDTVFNAGQSSIEQSTIGQSTIEQLMVNQSETDKSIRTKTLARTMLETACCAQVAALIGAALTPRMQVNRLVTNTINVSL